MKRFIKFVLLILLSPFVLFMLGWCSRSSVWVISSPTTTDKNERIWGVWRTPATAEPG